MLSDAAPEEFVVRVDLCGRTELGYCQVGDNDVQVDQVVDVYLVVAQFPRVDKGEATYIVPLIRPLAYEHSLLMGKNLFNQGGNLL